MKDKIFLTFISLILGLYFEQQDMWAKYLRRPDTLEKICFAQFAKMYRSGNVTKQNEVKDDQYDSNDEEDLLDNSLETPESNEDKFHYIITYDKNEKLVPLKKLIYLKNPQPGECFLMKKRAYPAALRFQKIKEAKNADKFMLHELMLYSPQREEIDIDSVREKYSEMHEGKRKVDLVKSIVMEYLEDVEEARYFAEIAKADMDLETTAIQLDPEKEQRNADSDSELDEDNEYGVYEHLNPDLADFLDETPKAGFYKKIDIPDEDSLKTSSRQLDYYQREVLNIAVKYSKDIVKSRKYQNPAPNAPLIMVHGGAGAGKSTVIKVVAAWTQKILQQAGDNPDCPSVIITAFCGTAASNVNGQTLHGAFGFPFGNVFTSLPDKSRDARRAALKNLKLVIIDEISMVKSDMLYMLDLRLQEITEKLGVPFGGIGIIVFGDMMQLKPIMGKYIFDSPANADFRTTHLIKPRWEMFNSIILEKNHRQGKDRQYADLLNRLRIAEHTEEDLEVLKSRVRPKGHEDLKKVDIFITATRAECGKANLFYIARLPGTLMTEWAVHFHGTRKNYKARVDQRDKSVGSTSFVNVLQLKKNCKVIIIHNIDVLDSLTNGQLGTLVDATETKEGKLDILIIKLDNSKAGIQNRKKHPNLAQRFPDCVFIERVSLSYSLRKNGGKDGSTATVIQFPIRLAHGVTAHKFQGQTIPVPKTVSLDLKSVFDPAQAYVMLSRVQSLEQVYIVDSIKTEKINISKAALFELQRLQKISLNSNPTEWDKESKSTLKVASMNIAGLNVHFQDLLLDQKLLKAQVLQLQETSLCLGQYEFSDYDIPQFVNTFFVSRGNGKGVVSYSKIFPQMNSCNSDDSMQIQKHEFIKLDVINVYRSHNGNKYELIQRLDKIIDKEKATLITGDFNICGIQETRNVVGQYLERQGFLQVIQEATQIQGRAIDHVYINRTDLIIELQRYSPYYTDHDALLITLNIEV